MDFLTPSSVPYDGDPDWSSAEINANWLRMSAEGVNLFDI